MATVIYGTRSFAGAIDKLPPSVLALLPKRLIEELQRLRTFGRIEELRLRRDRAASLTARGQNIVLNTVLDQAEMDGILVELCQGSLYAHRDSIASGYLTMEGGIRVGLCGRAATEDGRVIGV